MVVFLQGVGTVRLNRSSLLGLEMGIGYLTGLGKEMNNCLIDCLDAS